MNDTQYEHIYFSYKHLFCKNQINNSLLNVRQGLILAGNPAQQQGAFHSSMQLLETGLFDKAGFQRLHVAGHPEGNKDIDPDGSDRNVMDAMRWKQGFSERTDAQMALATQFAFEAGPIIEWEIGWPGPSVRPCHPICL